ncbi:hypothetical protein OsJ_16660 [Oryza sativa Japonica Group]|uniref:OSJNBa0032F06.11 protein n=1 Tax=Oryza sativa subsp. japonica TaxID=39947 RepID=Q7XPX0_ORYSJ|nr:hypothetical protein OsJ_16660 [Oryza sativa Japonica Group]CAE03428.1 OSJNBa0032F06.11 [Oryza sativa Japonica Group]
MAAAQLLDLNLEPPIDWDAIGDWIGPAHDLDYDMVWADADEDADAAGGEGDAAAGDGGAAAGDGGTAAQDGGEGDAAAGDGGGTVKKRRFYPDDLKIAIYLKLLACTHPPVMHHGVSKAVALQFDVPVRVVQRVWREGQNGGIEGVKNKLNFNCGRKRIEIDPEAIKAVPLAQRTTFQDLANALGLISSKLNIVNQ